MLDVSCIIINYNTSKFTLECIQATVTKTSEAISYEIIVVDNNSELSDYKNLKNNSGILLNLFDDKMSYHLYGLSMKERACAIGQGHYAISTEGLIFPCSRFISNNESPSFGVYPKTTASTATFIF